MRKFAISDIHGCNKTFLALLEKIQFSTADELYLLGDYIDRGPDSKGVIDSIFNLQKTGYQVHCLLGNHELMILEAFSDEDVEDRNMNHWLMNGGVATIQSFVTKDGTPDIPDIYFQFAQNLQFYLELDDYILVHAGLNFRSLNPFADMESMLWIRNWYNKIELEWLRGRVVVHGHTPIGRKAIEKQFNKLSKVPALNIDGGCVYFGKRDEMGDLCAFDLTEQVLHFQKNIE
ncbi:MAG: serine/threonine protein phosphatase [Saprospiraceae bacterium]|nr:serine/threonine protein phosphatase [Saprospiraceae bacterium]